MDGENAGAELALDLNTQPKVLVSFMSHDRVHAGWAYDYGHLLAHTGTLFTRGLGLFVKDVLQQCAAGTLDPKLAAQHMATLDRLFTGFSSGYPMLQLQRCVTSILPEGRYKLVQYAKKTKCSHILWLDADHTFPHDTLVRLLAHGKDFIGCNYVSRRLPFRFTAATTDNPALEMQTRPGMTHLEEASHIGMGVCLTKLSVFEGNGPWFSFGWIWDEEAKEWKSKGEDVDLARSYRTRGGKIWVDHALSNEIGHLGEFEYTPEIMATVTDQGVYKNAQPEIERGIPEPAL